MGVKNCKKGEVLWQAQNLNLRTLKSFQCGNRIDVDGNGLIWSIYQGQNNRHISFNQILHRMVEYLRNIAYSGGFILTIIVDGDVRPDCKRDSWSRIKDREIDRVSRIHCRLKAMNLYQKIKDNNASEVEKEDYENYKKTAKSLESKCAKSSLQIPKDFHSQLSQKLMALGACVPNINGGFIHETVLKAKFQADSVIACRSVRGKSDFILSKDSDFPVLIGNRCILITNISESSSKKRGRRKRNDEKEMMDECEPVVLKDASTFQVDIAGCDNAKMKELHAKLEGAAVGEWKEAKFANRVAGRRTVTNALKKKAKEISMRTIDPVVCPGLSKKEIKRRTGFKSEIDMFKFIGVICNGDIEKMTQTTSNLTWYEEWMLFFEYLWGRTNSRIDDIAALYKCKKKQTFYDIFDPKLYLLLVTRASWPTYVTYKEDRDLRDPKWNDKYDEVRPVMWDNSNADTNFKPSSALNQRITFSLYYATNCFKGGVFLQLCGWMGVAELWVGATCDSYYMVNADRILERQHEFAKSDLVNEKFLPCTMILDKGYRIIRPAFRHGGQQCIQPMFAESDNTFTSEETNYSATVAADRSGNERAVYRAKLSGVIKRGFYPRSCPVRFNNIWEAWGFQTNFMYAPVL